MNRCLRFAAVALAVGGMSAGVYAGPVVIDGTDANDHGSASATANLSGWLYMQKVLESLGGALAATVSKTVVDLGTTSGQARNAIDSAFSKSTLPGLGWSLVHVDGAANITAHLATLSTSSTGILYLPTYGNTGGDLTLAEMQAINGGATQINNFVAGAGNPSAGGALFSMGESGTAAYGWLTALIPGIVATDAGAGGIGSALSLTADGQTAFPGLTDADLSAGPWHGYFSGNLGGLDVLATGAQGNATRNVIIGGGAGTVIGCGQPGQPACPAPEPGMGWLIGIALGALGLLRRKPA